MPGILGTGTVGANIKYQGKETLNRMLMKILSQKRNEKKRGKRICYKAGAPASNTAADNPANLGDICVDVTNSHAYICTVYDATGAASTWVQIG